MPTTPLSKLTVPRLNAIGNLIDGIRSKGKQVNVAMFAELTAEALRRIADFLNQLVNFLNSLLRDIQNISTTGKLPPVAVFVFDMTKIGLVQGDSTNLDIERDPVLLTSWEAVAEVASAGADILIDIIIRGGNSIFGAGNIVITNVTIAGTTVTVTTSAPITLPAGIQIYITGVLGMTGINGFQTIATVSGLTFTFTATASGTYAGGGKFGGSVITIPAGSTALQIGANFAPTVPLLLAKDTLLQGIVKQVGTDFPGKRVQVKLYGIPPPTK